MPKGEWKMRIGIFGGSFDPVHNGHLKLAESAMEAFNLEKIMFVPCWESPYKDKRMKASVKDRISMLLLGEKEGDYITNFCEITREGISYTIDTIKYFKERFPKEYICFLFGRDSLKTFKTWKDYKKILTSVDCFFAGRDFMIEPVDIRSTTIRERIKKGKSIKGLVPEEVRKYIKKHKLYK